MTSNEEKKRTRKDTFIKGTVGMHLEDFFFFLNFCPSQFTELKIFKIIGVPSRRDQNLLWEGI